MYFMFVLSLLLNSPVFADGLSWVLITSQESREKSLAEKENLALNRLQSLCRNLKSEILPTAEKTIKTALKSSISPLLVVPQPSRVGEQTAPYEARVFENGEFVTKTFEFYTKKTPPSENEACPNCGECCKIFWNPCHPAVQESDACRYHVAYTSFMYTGVALFGIPFLYVGACTVPAAMGGIALTTTVSGLFAACLGMTSSSINSQLTQQQRESYQRSPYEPFLIVPNQSLPYFCRKKVSDSDSGSESGGPETYEDYVRMRSNNPNP